MKNIGFLERFLFPDYGNTKQISWAAVTIDTEKCTGCSLCAKACPANSIIVENKKARMKPAEGNLLDDTGISQCMGCGDCSALCPSDAITLKSPYRWTRFFKTINRGELLLPRL